MKMLFDEVLTCCIENHAEGLPAKMAEKVRLDDLPHAQGMGRVLGVQRIMHRRCASGNCTLEEVDAAHVQSNSA